MKLALTESSMAYLAAVKIEVAWSCSYYSFYHSATLMFLLASISEIFSTSKFLKLV